MDEYLTLFAALLGAIVGGSIASASAYLIQKQRFKRENVVKMRDEIYGPMLMNISKILEALKQFRHDHESLANLKGLTDDYLFFVIKQDLKNRFAEVISKLENYQSVRYAAELAFVDVIREGVKKVFEVDMGSNSNQPLLRLLIGKVMVSAISLKEAVFLELAPKDFVRTEKEEWGKDILIEVTIGGKKSNRLQDFESLYALVIDEMRKEPLYAEEKKQRKRLIQELENLLEQTEAFVNPQ